MLAHLNARQRVLLALLATVAVSAVLAAILATAAHATRPDPPGADCQPFSGRPCLLPFPDNLFTKPDPSTPTGLRVHLPAAAMPANRTGQRLSVAPYDRADGFSPGSAVVLHVPGLDNATAFARTHPVTLADMAATFAKNAPIVVINERTGRRQLIFSELDANARTPQSTDLLIDPGKAYTEGDTYIVALRDLRNADGHLISAPAWFARLRDNRPLPANERSQRARYAAIFAALGRAGIGRRNLYEAWDFTVASRQSVSSRLLAIRNSAFAQLGDRDLADGKVRGRAPRFTITSTKTLTPQLRAVLGTFRVPCYLIKCGDSATTGFHYSSSNPFALPTQIPGNVATAQFECIIPSSATGAHPARVSLYGHGLFGSYSEVEEPWVQALATQHNMVLCATNWWGLAAADEPFAASVVGNLNLFGAIVDRLQQGVLNFLYLGRLMINPGGFASSSEFRAGARPVIDTSHLYYDGNSQGGIMGGVTTAVSPDIQRAVLGVTGMDFGNLLLSRSTDFTDLNVLLDIFYTDPSMHPVIFDLMDQLWDRADPEGYAAAMTTHPLPDTPPHQVLMQIAYGDFQVSMYAGAAEARSIGASVYQPALDPDRARDRHLFYGIPAISRFPFHGSAVEIWDSGPGRVQPPPFANVPPTAAANNIDPHEDPRNTPAAQTQISDFLRPNGAVVDVCASKPCHTSVYTP